MPSWTRRSCVRPHRDTSEPDQTARYGVEHVRDTLGRERVSERRVCRVLGQPRATQRRSRLVPADEPRLVGRMTKKLACNFGRYGYRRITALLQHEEWGGNHKRVERLWRRKGLKVPQRQPKRRRLWDNAGSCVRLRPVRRDHVWSYDFFQARSRWASAVRHWRSPPADINLYSTAWVAALLDLPLTQATKNMVPLAVSGISAEARCGRSLRLFRETKHALEAKQKP